MLLCRHALIIGLFFLNMNSRNFAQKFRYADHYKSNFVEKNAKNVKYSLQKNEDTRAFGWVSSLDFGWVMPEWRSPEEWIAV